MSVWILPEVDIKPVDELMFRTDGSLNIVSSSKLHEFDLEVLQIWCVKRGVYQFPTEELVNWLAKKIAGKKAIEVCAGYGAIGRALGIPMTDSYMQTRPEIVAYYRSLRQEPITPPSDVQKFTANEAVKHFKPEIVIAAWATQLYQEGDSAGSVEGVDEIEIIKTCSYIHLGNDKPHGYKLSMRLPHEHHRFDWLVTRAQNQSLNHLGIWSKYSL